LLFPSSLRWIQFLHGHPLCFTFYNRTILTGWKIFEKSVPPSSSLSGLAIVKGVFLIGRGVKAAIRRNQYYLMDVKFNTVSKSWWGGGRIFIYSYVLLKQHVFMKLTFKEESSCLEFWEMICFSSSKTLALNSFS